MLLPTPITATVGTRLLDEGKGATVVLGRYFGLMVISLLPQIHIDDQETELSPNMALVRPRLASLFCILL